MLEKSMLDIMFDLPSHQDIAECIITPEVVTKGAEPRYVRQAARRKAE